MATVLESPNEDLKPQKKEIAVLKVLAEKVKGHVKWYSVSKCYGFISRNDDGGDLFVHRSVISSYSKRFPSLRNGEEVEFSVVETNQGIEATYVTGPNGQPVKGMRPIYNRYRSTSDPNDNGAQDGAEQPDRRTARGPRRRGSGRVRSAGVSESQKDENDHQGDDTHDHEDESQLKESGVNEESPNHVVPRQRRRPPRRTPRNRSLPVEDENKVDHDGQPEGVPNDRFIDSRGQGRRFRRPFHPRGGSRYMYNGWTPFDGHAMNGYNPPNGYRQMGDRNGFDPRQRRRPYGGGGFPRGPRHRPRPTGDENEPNEKLSSDEQIPVTTEPIVAEQKPDVKLEDILEKVKIEDCRDSVKSSSDVPVEDLQV